MSFVSQQAPSVHRLQDFVYSLDVQATLSRAYSDEGCACCEWHWGSTIPAIVYFQWPRLACDALSFPDSPSSEQGWGVKVGVNRRDLHVWLFHVIVFELLTTQSVCKRACTVDWKLYIQRCGQICHLSLKQLISLCTVNMDERKQRRELVEEFYKEQC